MARPRSRARHAACSRVNEADGLLEVRRRGSAKSTRMITALHGSLALSLAAALLVAGGAVRLRGTTLAAPAWWGAASLVLIATVELLASSGLLTADHAGPVRYAARVTVLCPMMAVLGAKRPQDRAWQWVVVALLATLWLPAAKWLLLDSGEEMDLFTAWQVFLAVLVVLGPLNYLPTGNWLPSLLVASGQCVLLVPYAPVLGWSAGEWTVPAATSAFLTAVAFVWLRCLLARHRGAQMPEDALRELNATWIRFRDAFGAFWAVRVMQRVEQGVESTAPRLALTWQGWAAAPDIQPSATSSDDLDSALAQAKRSLRTALRRFVRLES